MSESRRHEAARRGRRSTLRDSVARHGRLRRSTPLRTILTTLAAVVAVLVVSTTSVAAFAAWDVVSSAKKSVHLVDAKGDPIPSIGAVDGAVNVLLAGSDSGDGNPAYGSRGENLNDVTMLLHVSADHKSATVVSFPRDMFVSIPSCPSPKGGSYSAMS